ncbi:uncharacterized protein [Nicotiana tomentosiformis]|uniref:uncharacterized protein n=1 Tax=Nicotiana tomentosiformis TaxID=4098 RepID=UPI00388CDF86
MHPVVAAQAGDRTTLFSEAMLRLDKFTKLFPLHFSGTSSEDPRDFLDHCHEVLHNMCIVETNRVDFAAFQIIGSSRRWWRDYMLTRPPGSPTLTWDQFSQLFLGKFITVTLREEYCRQFERLQQGSMTITQYDTRFVDLARHATIFLPTERERMMRFIDGLTFTIRLQMDKETGSDISFQMFVDIARRIEGTFGRCHPPIPFHSVLEASHSTSGRRDPYVLHSRQPDYSTPSAHISAPPIQSYHRGYSARFGQLQLQQPQQQDMCFECGSIGHIRRFCPRLLGGMTQHSTRAMVLAPVALPSAQPARGSGQAARDGGQAIREGGPSIIGGG